MERFFTNLVLVGALLLAVPSCHKTEMMPAGPKISSHTRFMLGEVSSFSILNAGSDASVNIDFGDGESASGTSANVFSHTYQKPADYNVAVLVNGETITKTVRVYELRALQTIMPGLATPPYDKVMVMTHRAHSTDRDIPENSIAAVKECIRLGVDIVETDTHVTSDGVVVICHDQTINRTTDGKGDITKMTLDEIKQYHLLDRNNPPRVTSETIPTLEEYLKAARGKIYVNLDYSPRTASTIEVMSVVQKLDMVQGVLFYCNSVTKVNECLDLDANTQVYTWGPGSSWESLVGKGNYFAQYAWNSTDLTALSKGMVCSVNMKSLDNPTQSEGDGSAFVLDTKEVDQILTNFPQIRVLHTDTPEELIEYLKSKGLR